MNLVHSFRLRDPWQCQRTPEVVRWSRGFHKPTRLDEDDRLWIIISGLPREASVRLNGDLIEPQGAWGRFDVSGKLGRSNQLEIAVSAPAGESSACRRFPFDVRLAIVEP